MADEIEMSADLEELFTFIDRYGERNDKRADEFTLQEYIGDRDIKRGTAVHILAKMRDDGLILSREGITGGKRRVLYHFTEKGLAALNGKNS